MVSVIESAPSASLAASRVVRPGHAALRVAVIDDHRSYAEAISLALARADGIEAVKPYTSFQDAMASLHRDRPDVVVLDWQLPDVEGTEALATLRATRPDTPVVLVSGHADAELTRRAIRAGASFVLPKESSVGDIASSLRRAARGERDERIDVSGAPASPSDDPNLSPREAEVLWMLSSGKDVPQIARELFLSVHTVRGYVKDLRYKFDVHSQLELVAVARRRRILAD